MQRRAQTERFNCHNESCARNLKYATTPGLGRGVADLFTGLFGVYLVFLSVFIASRSFSSLLKVTV
jgi:hypothetical protein